MRVAVLTGALCATAQIARVFQRVRGCELYVVVCPEDKAGLLRRIAKETCYMLRNGICSTAVWRLLMRGRVIYLRKPLDHPDSTCRLRACNFDVGLHKAAVIYRDPTLACFRLGILNPHIGILPEYRGRSVMEWSILLGGPTGVTVFFMDGGIDTGERIVLRRVVELNGFTSVSKAKKYLFSLDAVLLREAVEILQTPGFVFARNDVGHRYYPMSDLFTGIAESVLKEQRRARTLPVCTAYHSDGGETVSSESVWNQCYSPLPPKPGECTPALPLAVAGASSRSDAPTPWREHE